MAYRAMGKYPGRVVLFLHGNPTSSYDGRRALDRSFRRYLSIIEPWGLEA